MNPVAQVVRVNFITLTAAFTLVLARLIAQDHNAVPLDDSVCPPPPRVYSSE